MTEPVSALPKTNNMKLTDRQVASQAYRWSWKAMRLREQADKLQAEVEKLEETERSMKESLSWRLTAPLRWCDAAVRSAKTRRVKVDRNKTFSWLDRAVFQRSGKSILADYSLTLEDRSSPGMRRVTKGLLRGAMEAGLSYVPVDLRGGEIRDISPQFGGKKFDLGFPEVKCSAFLLADAGWEYADALRPLLERLRNSGIPSAALVHDAIPFDHPDLCLPGSVDGFSNWMDTVFDYCSNVICVSEYSAERVRHHLALRRPDRLGHCMVRSWLPGNETWAGQPAEDQLVPADDFILCVGTVEPRKNYAMLLQAMDALWAESSTDCTLVIFGATGWKTDEFAKLMKTHPEWGKRLWWFDGGTDEHLHALYDACTVFALPSIDEGFSQPLSEAASLGKPAVMSDLPVFRERVTSGGYYFDLQDMSSLKRALLAALAPGAEPTQVRQTTWVESARSMMRMLGEVTTPCADS